MATASGGRVFPVGAQTREDLVIMGPRHRRMSHDPVEHLRVGNGEQRLEAVQLRLLESHLMSVGKGPENQVKLLKATALRAEQSFLPADFDIGQFGHAAL